MARSVYDRFGFDKYGYNKDGYDRMGYNREGYDRQGFDRNGLNRQGINKLTGFDKDGFDKEGFNKAGYNREGYDREGFDKYGFNIQGYDKNGYNSLGLDKDGYNQQGYDREGFNLVGVNREGYDREGFDLYGFNSEGMNKNGFNIYGISDGEINVLGYFPDGFDIDGKSIDGFSKELFDEDGYHIYTGFNLKGYDREGFNINGFDYEGYDHEGFHSITGYNREGFDREGFGQSGYNKKGFDRSGYNREGFDEKGYDIDGYNIQGYDCNGYDRNGYDKKGYDINGYDVSGMLDPLKREKEISIKMNPEDDHYEAAFFKKCEAQIKSYYREQVRKEVMKEYVPRKRTYIDRWGFIQTDIIEPDMEQAQWKIDVRVNAVLKEPYFCHVDYSGNPELYIGKQAVHGWITDWADERASLYYQYQMYIGDKETELNLVRDIILSNSKYRGYKDLYNNTRPKENIVEVADAHLSQIIEANQKNKKIHDIIESIQRNQYQIITSNKDRSSLVLGCAGSGKTMILMHKIRYMKYNYQDLNMDDIMVISPTDILGRESRELSQLLQIEKIQQFTTASFYEKECKDMLLRLNIPFEEFHIWDNGEVVEAYYWEEVITDLKSRIFEKNGYGEEGRAFVDEQEKIVEKLLDHHIVLSGLKKELIMDMRNLYIDSVNEIRRAGKKDIERLIRRIDTEIRNRELMENVKDFIQFLQNNKIFMAVSHPTVRNKESIEKLFFYTRNIVNAMNYDEFLRVRYYKAIVTESKVECIQTIQLFAEKKLDLEGVRKILKEWETITEQDAESYIAFIEQELKKVDRIERKRDVLQYLLDNNIVKDTLEENNTFKYDISFEKLLKLFDETGESLSSIGYTPFSYFEEYEKIIRKQNRLADQKKNPRGKNYLFDTILAELEVEYRTDSDIVIPLSKAFTMAYLVYGYTGEIDTRKRYIFVDEFQDFSTKELEFFKELYPNAVLNLFGDVKQCINAKGIKEISDIPSELYDERPAFINENYRNARQITEYVNQIFAMNMLPVGLNGIQRTVEDISGISISEDDRVAIIVAASAKYMDEYKEKLKMNFYVESREIVRGIYNVIPINMAKGLEFEKVIVFQEGLSENEFYVACTRAITELYVIPEKVEDKEDIHNYTLIVYKGNLRKKINIAKSKRMYISILEDNKEKKIPVDYIKESHQVYILMAIYVIHKEAVDKYFSSSDDNKDTCLNKRMEEKEKQLPIINFQRESVNERVVEQSRGVNISELRECKVVVYKGNLKGKVDMSKIQQIAIPIMVDGTEKKIPMSYLEKNRCVYISNVTYINYKRELDEYFINNKYFMSERK